MDLSINEGTLAVTGGLGDSAQSAILIKKTPKGLSAAGAEQLLLTQRYGVRGRAWRLEQQDHFTLGARTYDTFHIVLQDGTERTLYFDVTDLLAHAQSHFGPAPRERS